MRLYHYTAHEHWPAIAREGLSRGDVPVSPDATVNAVWLTTSANPAAHGLSGGELLPYQPTLAALGIPRPPSGFVRTYNKRAVRLEVDIPADDTRLVRWSQWAEGRVAPQWRRTLEETGGGRALARTWYLYHGVISTDWIREKRDLSPAPDAAIGQGITSAADASCQDTARLAHAHVVRSLGQHLHAARSTDVVMAVLPDGLQRLVKGRRILERLVATGTTEAVSRMDVPVPHEEYVAALEQILREP